MDRHDNSTDSGRPGDGIPRWVYQLGLLLAISWVAVCVDVFTGTITIDPMSVNPIEIRHRGWLLMTATPGTLVASAMITPFLLWYLRGDRF